MSDKYIKQIDLNGKTYKVKDEEARQLAEEAKQLAEQGSAVSWDDLTDKPFYIGESEIVIDRETLYEFELHGPTYEYYYDYDDEGNIIDEWADLIEYGNFDELSRITDFVDKTIIVTVDDQEYVCETTQDTVTWEEDIGDGEYETYEGDIYTLISNDGNLKIVCDDSVYPRESIYINGILLDRYDENVKHYLRFEEEYEKTVTPVKTLDLAVMPDGYPKYSSSGKAYLTSERVSIDQGTLETFRERWYDLYEGEYYYGEEYFAYVIPLPQIFHNLVEEERGILTIRAYENNGKYTDFIYSIKHNYYYWGYAHAGNTKLIWPQDYCDGWFTDLDDNWYVEEHSWTNQISYYGGYKKDSIIVPQEMAKKYVSFEVLCTPDKIDTLNPDFLPSNIRSLPDEFEYLQNQLSNQSYLTDKNGDNPIEVEDLPKGYGGELEEVDYVYIGITSPLLNKSSELHEENGGYGSDDILLIDDPNFILLPNSRYEIYVNNMAQICDTNEKGECSFAINSYYEDDEAYAYIKRGNLYNNDGELIYSNCWYIYFNDMDGEMDGDFIEIIYKITPSYKQFDKNLIPSPDELQYTTTTESHILFDGDVSYTIADEFKDWANEGYRVWKGVLNGFKFNPGYESVGVYIDLLNFEVEMPWTTLSVGYNYLGHKPEKWYGEEEYEEVVQSLIWRGVYIEGIYSDTPVIYLREDNPRPPHLIIDGLLNKKVPIPLAEGFIPETISRVGHTHSWNDLTDKPFGEETIKSEEPDVLLYTSEYIEDQQTIISDWTIVPSEDPYLITLTNSEGYRITSDNGNYSFKVKITGISGNAIIYEITEFNGTGSISQSEIVFTVAEGNKLRLDLPGYNYTGYLSIYGYERTFINTLNEKFIPENIARTSEIESLQAEVQELREMITALQTALANQT